MARRSIGSRRQPRGRMQNRIYIAAGLIIVIVMIAVIYGLDPFGKDEGGTSIDSNDVNVPGVNVPAVNDIDVPVVRRAAEEEPNTKVVEVVPKVDVEANPEVADLIAEAMTLIDASPSRIIEARERLNETLAMPMSKEQRSLVEVQLSKLADKWLFSRTIFPQDQLCGTYKVKQGDLLSIISKQFKVPYEILMEINHIRDPRALREGDTIKVINGPFRARVYRSAFTMDLYLQNTFIRRFPVGLGKPGMETPTGLWLVKPGGKLVKPVWTDPIGGKTYHPEDPDYPLGSRWIALEGKEGAAKDRTGFAIHGTKEPEQIGTAGSQGCIRLHNGDAIFVYNLLAPGHSFVRVED